MAPSEAAKPAPAETGNRLQDDQLGGSIGPLNSPADPSTQDDANGHGPFYGTSVELDAIPAHQLRQLVRECIERHVDQQQLTLLRTVEDSERELLTKWAATYSGEVRP
jgi:hypothetical protein